MSVMHGKTKTKLKLYSTNMEKKKKAKKGEEKHVCEFC